MNLQPHQICANTASLWGYGLHDVLDKLCEMHFEAVELLSFDGARHRMGRLAGFWFERMTPEDRDRLCASTDRFRQVAVHLPFFDCPLFTHNVYIARTAYELMLHSMDGLAFLGGLTGVIHGNVPFGFDWRELAPTAVDTFRRLGDEAARRGVRLGVETMFPASTAAYVELIDTIDHPQIGATLDVGHVGYCQEVRECESDEEKVAEYHRQVEAIIDALGPRIFHVHLHDLREGDWRDHCEVGTGLIDFPRVIGRLARSGYDGLLSFELETPDREASLLHSRARIAAILDDLAS